jgi:FlaA1/EpsC-like NDP-sugar epimerase
MEKRQPLGCPRDTRRFFISLREAGEICLLAAACAPDRHILIPKLDAGVDLRELEEIAAAFLRWNGFEPAIYVDEEEARANMPGDLARKRYPLLLTPLDTMGEKPYEEFVGERETVRDLGMSSVQAIAYLPLSRPEVLPEFVRDIVTLIASPEVKADKARIVEMMRAVVPELRHMEAPLSLDQRM